MFDAVAEVQGVRERLRVILEAQQPTGGEIDSGIGWLLWDIYGKLKEIETGLLAEVSTTPPGDGGEVSPLMLSGLIVRLFSLQSVHGDMRVTYGDGEPVRTIEHVPGFQDPASDLPEDYSPPYVRIYS